MKNGRKNFWRRFFPPFSSRFSSFFLRFSLFFLRICRSLVNKVARRTETFGDRHSGRGKSEARRGGGQTLSAARGFIYRSAKWIHHWLSHLMRFFFPLFALLPLPPAPLRCCPSPFVAFFFVFYFRCFFFSLLRSPSLSVSFCVDCQAIVTGEREAVFLSLCV